MSTQYHIYGNGGSGPINYGSPIATVSGTTWSSSALSVGLWKFGVRAFDSVSTLEEKNVDACVTINVSSSGTDITQLPPAPLFLTAVPKANGSIRVSWLGRAEGYHIYAGVGSISYASPVATAGSHATIATITGYADGASVVIGVRGFIAGIGEEQNTNTVTVTAMATGPAAVVGLAGTATAVSGDGRS